MLLSFIKLWLTFFHWRKFLNYIEYLNRFLLFIMSLVSSKTNAVQSKIHCLFESTVVESVPSKKRQGQNFKVVASESISKHAIGFNKMEKVATEKIDGTCCFVDNVNGL